MEESSDVASDARAPEERDASHMTASRSRRPFEGGLPSTTTRWMHVQGDGGADGTHAQCSRCDMIFPGDTTENIARKRNGGEPPMDISSSRDDSKSPIKTQRQPN